MIVNLTNAKNISKNRNDKRTNWKVWFLLWREIWKMQRKRIRLYFSITSGHPLMKSLNLWRYWTKSSLKIIRKEYSVFVFISFYWDSFNTKYEERNPSNSAKLEDQMKDAVTNEKISLLTKQLETLKKTVTTKDLDHCCKVGSNFKLITDLLLLTSWTN